MPKDINEQDHNMADSAANVAYATSAIGQGKIVDKEGDPYTDKIVRIKRQYFQDYSMHSHTVENVSYLVFKSEKTKKAFFAFAGSDDRKDWERNFTLIPRYDKNQQFLGFDLEVGVVEKAVLAELNKLKEKGYEIHISGHSKGGALSHLTALYARADEKFGDYPLHIVTKNSAAPGNAKTAQIINDLPNVSIYNYIKNLDIVSIGTLPGRTAIIKESDKDFIITEVQMKTDTASVAQRKMGTIAKIPAMAKDPLKEHDKDRMSEFIHYAVSYWNKGSVVAHVSDIEMGELTPPPPIPLQAANPKVPSGPKAEAQPVLPRR